MGVLTSHRRWQMGGIREGRPAGSFGSEAFAEGKLTVQGGEGRQPDLRRFAPGLLWPKFSGTLYGGWGHGGGW